MGHSLLLTGDITAGCAHYDQALALYDLAEHRPLVTRFGLDTGVSVLSHRSLALWMLGYPDAALADADHALNDARAIDQAATLMDARAFASFSLILCGNYTAASALADELITLAGEKGAALWKGFGMMNQGCVLLLSGKALNAVDMLNSVIAAWRLTGATVFMPWLLLNLATAYADLGQVDEACRCVGEGMSAIETTKERWFEADANRIAGEIALKSSEPDAAKAEAYFERALAIARQQQAKSWELRAAMSLARLWRDQGKVQKARELLVPVYGWFTEGFDTLDLKEAKALLNELSA
jgi:predicted ATPase